MLCERCQKNSAVIHVDRQVNGQTISYNLCADCAAAVEIHFSFNNFFDDFLSMFLAAQEREKTGEHACASCGLSYAQFKKTGRFGCFECYKSFEPMTKDVLGNIHGSRTHMGKIPKTLKNTIGYAKELEQFKIELQKAIAAENYESAAEIRDRIKELEKSVKAKEETL